MMYKIVRFSMLILLFTTLILPLLLQFPIPFTAQISNSVSSFLGVASSYIQNVKGLINQFLYRGGGDLAINIFNSLIWASLIMPVFGLTARLTVFIYRYFF